LRVIGIDPGTYNMGVGIVDSESPDLNLVHVVVLRPKKSDPMSTRLFYLFQELGKLLSSFLPDSMAIEQPFVSRNVRSAMSIGQAQSVAMIAAASAGIEITGYSPSQVKQSVTDYGASSKEQVQEMVRALLELDYIPSPTDATDALAVAICHINSVESLNLTLNP